MPEISTALDMSGPTVLTIVNELKSSDVIKEVGEYESTGGRKAKAFASVKDSRYAIGLDITKHHISLVYTDLSKKLLGHQRIRRPFFYAEQFFKEVGDLVREFIEENQIPEDKIEGVGISVPAIVDRQKNVFMNSRVLGVEYIPCERWMKYIPYRCELLNDANSAMIAELNSKSKLEGGMVYLSLSNSVGGAVVFPGETGKIDDSCAGLENATLYTGNNWRSGEFGHIVIRPDGKTCYCGKKGCLDAYCSATKLANLEDGNLEAFFTKMEAGDEQYRKIWREYLKNLSIAVDNIRMCFDCEVVLGGYVGNYMGPYIPYLWKLLKERDIFDSRECYIRACRCGEEASAYGAAVYEIENYIATI